MKIAYKRTFGQYADVYLTTYYASGFQIVRRSLGGPLMLFLGAVLFLIGQNPRLGWWLRAPLWLAGGPLFLYGVYYALRPFIDLGLMYTRKEKLVGDEQAVITLELRPETLYASLPEGEVELPYKDILAVQHRSDSAWIVTKRDQILQVPRDGLLEGDHDAFVERLHAIVNPPKSD